MPLFSIITVCYNSEKTIVRTLESVLAQEFKDYEYIIVDGASSDRTVEIIRKYEPLFEGRMHWKSEPDKGIYDAFNKGILQAGGEYVWLVNSDDFIENDALSVIEKSIADNNTPDSAVLSFYTRFVESSGRSNIVKAYKNQERKNYLRDWVISPHPSIIVPRKIYTDVYMYDPGFRIIGDIDWFHNVYKRGVRFNFLPYVIINFTDSGISNNVNQTVIKKDWKYYFNKNYRWPISVFHEFLQQCHNIRVAAKKQFGILIRKIGR